MTDQPPSLAEFATANRGRRPQKCFTCSSPFREEIERERAAGTSLGVIARWLRAHHSDEAIGESALLNHFQNGHADTP